MQENVKKYVELKDLEAYQLSREYSRKGWELYQKLHWQIKKVTGDQMIESTDSVGANIAEGYGRFHYLDKNKFYYNARGSLLESGHWFDILCERGFLGKQEYDTMIQLKNQIAYKINSLIKSQFIQKSQ